MQINVKIIIFLFYFMLIIDYLQFLIGRLLYKCVGYLA
jgi:hypothetical protein